MEGFAITSENPSYSVSYMAHLEDTGDTKVFRDGDYCGTRGESRRVEGITVWVEKK
jgi:hypothetical protein